MTCCKGGKAQPNPTFLTRMLNKIFVSEEEKDRRLTICKKCNHYNSTLVQCKKCGCFLEAKTRLLGFHCALDEPLW